MGAAAVAREVGRGRRFCLAAGLALLVTCACGVGSARAATCDNSWKTGTNGTWDNAGDWTSGVPTSGQNVCITAPGHYFVDLAGLQVNVNSLQLGGPSSTPVLTISGQPGGQASLTLTAGGSIASGANVTLSENCSTAGCVSDPAASLINDSSTTPLTNAGSIVADLGSDGGVSSRELGGDITNTGTIDVNAPLTYAVRPVLHATGTLDNRGTLDLHNETMTLLFDPIHQTVPTVKNDTGGTITNDGGTGHVFVDASGRFIQAGGTTSPATVNPAHPAVLFDDLAYTNPLPTLSYTGGGASAIEVRGGAKLSGNIASGQSLNINGTDCAHEALVTAASGFTNAGTLTLGGACSSGLAITSGTLTNTGTLMAAAGGTRELKGGLVNSGSFRVNGSTAFDKSSATLQQTGGSTTIASGAILDASGSGSTFQLQGGTLSGGGQSQGTAAVINGPLNNTGGEVIPGSTTAPGLITVDGVYTQGSGGKLTETIKGTKVGTGYSQLASAASMSIAGTLAINTLSGPTAGHLYTILATSGSVSGKFSKVTGRFKPEGAFPPGWSAGYKVDYQFKDAVALDAEAAAGLRVKRAGPGTGTVTSSPSGITCGTTCDAPFFQTQTVTLTAHPGSGWVFGGWAGACTGSSKTCQVKMSRARTVTARFSHRSATKLTSSRNPGRVGKKVIYTATVSPNPKGGKVKFTSSGKTISGCRAVAVNPATGKAKCSATYPSPGTRQIKATYLGNGSFAPSAGRLTETVRR
jgi:hypothetical protein